MPFIIVAIAVTDVDRMPSTDRCVGYAAVVIFVIAYLVVRAEESTHLRKSKPVILAPGIQLLLIASD